MESYIVRIYRRGQHSTRNLVGIVERVGIGDEIAFTNFEKLWDILSETSETPGRKNKKKGGKKAGL